MNIFYRILKQVQNTFFEKQLLVAASAQKLQKVILPNVS